MVMLTVFDAVGNNIGQYLSDFQFVGVEQGAVFDVVLEVELKVLVLGYGRKHLRDFLAELADVEGLFAHLQLALFEAGVFQ